MDETGEIQPRLNELINERRTLQPAIYQLLSPEPIKLKKDQQTTFAQISNHLRVCFVRGVKVKVDQDGFYKVDQRELTKDENPLLFWSRSLFGARAGETIDEITIRPDMTLEELATLLKTIKHHALKDREDSPETEFWFQSLAKKRDEILNTASALYLVSQEDIISSSNLQSISNFLFRLGQTLDLNGTHQGKTLEEIAKEKEQKDPQALLRGLVYARYGEKEPRGKLSQAETFAQAKEHYLKIYERIKDRPNLLNEITSNILTQALPAEAKRSWTKLEESAPSALVMAGIERLYQKLLISPWVKEFLAIPQEKQLAYLRKNFHGPIFRALADKLIGFYENPPKITEFKRLSSDLQKELAIKLYDHLTTLGLGEEKMESFFQWVRAQDFSQKKENLERQLMQAKTEREKQNVLAEYSQFQQDSLKQIITQMRTYPGWVEKKTMMNLREASPTNILREGGLNCVGRSLLLGVVAPQLGFSPHELLYASSISHISLMAIFKDGQGGQVNPSSKVGGELVMMDRKTVETVKQAIAKEGMVLGIKIKKKYYSFFPFERGITAAVLGNFVNYILRRGKENIKKAFKLRSFKTILTPSGHTLKNWFFDFFLLNNKKPFRELDKKTQQTAIQMAKKLARAQPDIGRVLEKDRKKRRLYSEDFFPFMDECLSVCHLNKESTGGSFRG